MTLQRQILINLTALLTAGFICALPAPEAAAQSGDQPGVASSGEILAPIASPGQGEVELAPPGPQTNSSLPDGSGAIGLPTTDEIPQDDYFTQEVEPLPEFSWSNYFLVVGAMFLLLGVLWFVVWSLKKRNALPGGSMLSKNAFKLETSLSLGGKRALLLVRFMDNRYLLGVTEQQISLIKELDSADDLHASDQAKANTFATLLKKAGQKGDA